jgi:hypothetical protein
MSHNAVDLASAKMQISFERNSAIRATNITNIAP